MRRLSKTDLRELEMQLRSWHALSDFAGLLNQADAQAGFYAISQGGMKIWREGFVAMSCAQLSHATEVRLGEDPPDFRLRYRDHERAFEIVDILPAGKRFGSTYDHYAQQWNAGDPIPIEHIDMESEHDALPGDLERQITAKLQKAYPPGLILVADIHHTIFPITDFTVEQRLAGIARAGLRGFDEVWLRKGAHLLRISREGETRMAPIAPPEH